MENPSPSPGIRRTCPSCNSSIAADHEFCEICGAKMPELPACRTCGARFLAPVKFCEVCGTPVLPHEPPEPAIPARPESGPVLPPPVKHKVRKLIEVPATPEPDHPGTAEDALFFPSEHPVPVKPDQARTRVIGAIVLLVVVIAAVWFIGLPMLTGNGGPGVFSKPVTAEITPLPHPGINLTTTPTLPASPVPTPAFGPLIPQPTQKLPVGQRVFFEVRKDPDSARIFISFAGIAGTDSISSADVKVTQPGGAVATGVIMPLKGVTELTLDGSRETDRVEIIAKMTSGQTYRVLDELVPFTG